MEIKDDYLHRYQALQAIVIKSYVDYYTLNSLGVYSPKITDSSSLFVLQHYADLMKEDLCLNLWKIVYDNDSDANSLPSLNAYLRKNGVESLFSKSEAMKRMENTIKDCRTHFIAHNDINHKLTSIQVEDLYEVLVDAYLALNSRDRFKLCVNLQNRVE